MHVRLCIPTCTKPAIMEGILHSNVAVFFCVFLLITKTWGWVGAPQRCLKFRCSGRQLQSSPQRCVRRQGDRIIAAPFDALTTDFLVKAQPPIQSAPHSARRVSGSAFVSQAGRGDQARIQGSREGAHPGCKPTQFSKKRIIQGSETCAHSGASDQECGAESPK